MTDLELYHAHLLLGDSAKPIKVTLLHLPRPGDTVSHEGVHYEVEKVVFTLVVGTTPFPFGYPNVYCRNATQSIGGDSQPG